MFILITAWEDNTPQWCTKSGRKLLSDKTPQVDNCKKLCIEKNPECRAIEWWERHGGLCFECTNTSLRTVYKDTTDLAHPPHVYIVTNKGGRGIDD